MAAPSVGDQLAFEQLPDEVRELARRVLGDGPAGVEQLADAYEEGFEDMLRRVPDLTKVRGEVVHMTVDVAIDDALD